MSHFGAGFLETYGCMYGDEIAQAVVIPNPGLYVAVPGSLTGGPVNGFVFELASQLRTLFAGNYLVNWSMSVNSVGIANQDISGSFMIDGAPTHFASHNFTTLALNKNASIGATGIVALIPGGIIQLCVANHTATNNLVIEHATLSILRVGE